jgi:O-antigen/teichoic acid export membrane protein
MSDNHQESVGPGKERFRLFRDTLLNHAGLIVPAIVNLIALPWLIRYAGRDAYGLWVAILSISVTVNTIDLGLSQATTRTVAESNDSPSLDDDSRRFLQSAFVLSIAMGTLAAVIVGSSIPGLASSLRVDLGGTALPVAVSVAVSVFAQRIADFVTKIFQGAGRFGTLNAFVATFSLSRTLGAVVVLKAGYGLLGLAAWHAANAVVSALVALTIVSLSRRAYWSWRIGFHWPSVKRRAQFALGSQTALLFYSLTIDSAPVLILGWQWGPSAIVTYHLGQRIAMMAFQAFSSGSSVVFTMACEAITNRGRMVNVLRLGVRWMAVMAIPTCAVLFTLAPFIVTAWLKSSDPQVATVLRIATASMLFVALSDPPLHAVWVSSTATLLKVFGGLMLPSAATCWVLVHFFAARGAALSVLLTVIAFAVAVSVIAGRRYDVQPHALAIEGIRGLTVPVLAACVIAALGAHWLAPAGWPMIAGIAAVSLALFVSLFLWFGAQDDERDLLRARFAHLD